MMAPIICAACMTWHPPPKCSHDPEAPCRRCGDPRGYRWLNAAGLPHEPPDFCWRCARASPVIAEDHHRPRILNKHRDAVPRGAVYIGRRSKWGNPFDIGKHGTRAEVIAAYRAWISDQPDLIAALTELRGRDLVCFCAPAACHGDILRELANA